MRPGVIQRGGQALPVPHAHGSLQAVVIGTGTGFELQHIAEWVPAWSERSHVEWPRADRRVHLVDVAIAEQLAPARPYISHLHGNMVVQLVLDVQVVVLYVGRGDVLIYRKG